MTIVRLLFFIPLYCFAVAACSQTTTFIGSVVDFDSNMPLAGASIAFNNQSGDTQTDSNGRFTLRLTPGSYKVVITFSGYQKLATTIYSLEDSTRVFRLKRKPSDELQEVIIESRSRTANVRDLRMGDIRINPSQLKKTPLILGEADILRTLTLQPGVVTPGETVSGFHVRGGNADQNLVLVDGAPLFNISHLLGFYTGISTDAVQDVNFFKAGIPVQYGGRLSSIMTMNLKSGDPDSVRSTGGVGPVSSRFFVNGPIIRQKLRFMAGGRIAYPKLIMNLFPPGDVKNSNAFYYDDVFKLTATPNDRNEISLSFYNSFDKFKFPGDTSFQWKNYLGALQWRTSFSNRFSALFTGNFSHYHSSILGEDPLYAFDLSSSVKHREGKAIFDLKVADKHSLSFGGGLIRYSIDPGQQKPVGTASIINVRKVNAEQANEWSAFLSSENEITPTLSIQAGVRVSRYQYLGPRDVYLYQVGEPRKVGSIFDTLVYAANERIKEYQSVEPRVLLRFLVNASTSLKAAYNRTQQYLHFITNAVSVTPVDYWKLSDPYVPPQVADHYTIGLFKNFNNNTFEASAEAYYKNFKNGIDYKNGADLALNPALETQLLPTMAYAYGVELSVRKMAGPLTGMAAYTFARTLTKVVTPFIQERVNGGNYFPGNSDKPHTLVLFGSLKLGKGWQFSSNFFYTTGRPTTNPDGTYMLNGTVVVNYSLRNEDRLPDYHRLDVAFSYDSRRFVQQRRYSVLNFSIYNLYARQNAYSQYFRREFTNLRAYKLSVIGSLIPSVSWNFNF